MTSCTIIISHYESLPFLSTCISQIRKYRHIKIRQHIIIADQSSEETHLQIREWYNCSADITIVKLKPLYSGYSIDFLMKYFGFKTKYVCQLHVDAFPINKNWLYLPIRLIQENNFAFVGQLHFINYSSPVYPPDNPFFSMSPTFNVARTETYKEMATEAGFTRFHNRTESFLEYKNNDWSAWAKEDYNHRGSDDDTVAFHWEDTHREHNKLGLAISGFIEPKFGRIIDDLVFHFGSCREATTVMDLMPELYQEYTKKINEDYSDELIFEMILMAMTNKPPEMEILSRNYWDGKLKKSFPPTDELNKRIEELKK